MGMFSGRGRSGFGLFIQPKEVKTTYLFEKSYQCVLLVLGCFANFFSSEHKQCIGNRYIGKKENGTENMLYVFTWDFNQAWQSVWKDCPESEQNIIYSPFHQSTSTKNKTIQNWQAEMKRKKWVCSMCIAHGGKQNKTKHPIMNKIILQGRSLKS